MERGTTMTPDPFSSSAELAGMLKRLAKAVTVTEMNQVIRKRGGYS